MLRPQLADGMVETGPSALQRLARLISNVLSPPVMAAPVLAMGVRLSDVPGTWRYAVMYIAVAVVTPMFHLIWLMRTGRVSDYHLADRRDRTHPFLVSIACNLIALGLVVWRDAPPIFAAVVRAALLQVVILFLITLVWQVSIHSATIASMATMAVVFFGASAMVVLLLIPLVGWARVYLGRHTISQVVVGAAIGAATLLYAMAPFLPHM